MQTWVECQAATNRYSGAVFQSYRSFLEADAAWRAYTGHTSTITPNVRQPTDRPVVHPFANTPQHNYPNAPLGPSTYWPSSSAITHCSTTASARSLTSSVKGRTSKPASICLNCLISLIVLISLIYLIYLFRKQEEPSPMSLSSRFDAPKCDSK